MSSNVSRVGVPVVSLGQPDFTTLLPALTAITPAVSAITATNLVNNEIRNGLTQSTNYQVMVGLVGYDQSNGGYTVSPCSGVSGVVSLTDTQNAIWVQVPNASFPTNSFNAICAILFLKQGAGNWQQCDFAYLDSAHNFNFFISAAPIAAAFTTTQAILQSATTDASGILGSRVPYGGILSVLGPTTGGVTFDRTVSQVTISPDDGPDYQIVTSRGCNLTFSTLPNAMIDFVRATSGLFVQAPGDGTSTVRVAQQTMLTAQAVLKGNRHILVTMPPDQTGAGELRLYMGNLTISQVAVQTAFTKTAQAAIQYNLQTASTDTLLKNQNSEVVYQRFGG